MEQTLPETLKTFVYNNMSVKTWNRKAYNSFNRAIKLYIPLNINLFKIDDTITILRTVEGFIVKKSGIDSKQHTKFGKNRTIILDRSVDYENSHGEYEYEILDEDTLKLIKL